MDKIRIRKLISSLAKRDYRRMYMNDFFLTWEKTDDEIAATFLVAEILRGLREANISCRMFDSGSVSPCSATTPRVPGSASPAPATCSALKCRISTKANRRLPTAKPCAKPRT